MGINGQWEIVTITWPVRTATPRKNANKPSILHVGHECLQVEVVRLNNFDGAIGTTN